MSTTTTVRTGLATARAEPRRSRAHRALLGRARRRGLAQPAWTWHGTPLTPAPRGWTRPHCPSRSSRAEEDRKLAAVRTYAAQMKVMEPFLLSFVRTTELFSVRRDGPGR